MIVAAGLLLAGLAAAAARAPQDAAPGPGAVWIAGERFELAPHRQAFAAPCLELVARGRGDAGARDGETGTPPDLGPRGTAGLPPDPSPPCSDPGRSVVLVRGAPGELRGRVDSLALGDAAAAARTVFLHGSPSVVDWYECLAPRGESRLLRGLRRAHGPGATLVGRGRAGALLGAWLAAEPDELERPLRNPRRAGEARLVAGLGAVDWGLLEVGVGARFGRMVELCVEERLRWAAFVGADAALAIEPGRGRATAHGAGAVLVLDLREGRRLRDGLREVRLSVLADGDVWRRRGDEPDSGSRPAPPAGPPEPERVVADALDAAVWTDAVDRLLAGNVARPQRWRDGRFAATLRADPVTRVPPAAGAGTRGGPARVLGALVDLERIAPGR